jgi:hypothetical protein
MDGRRNGKTEGKEYHPPRNQLGETASVFRQSPVSVPLTPYVRCLQERWNRVQLCLADDGNEHVVKSIDNSSQELATLRKLRGAPPSASGYSYIVPTELVVCEQTTVAVMTRYSPATGSATYTTLEFILQFAEEVIEVHHHRHCPHHPHLFCGSVH